MDFYEKLGGLLSEALEKGEILKKKPKERAETETPGSDASKADGIKIEPEKENTTRLDSRDKEKAKTFTFTQFGHGGSSGEKPKRTFSFEQFAKMSQEAAHTEPKVQIYKFSQLVIPQNVLYALNVIGIPTNADFESAKKIYREKIMYYHPDKWLGTPYIEQAKTNTQTLNAAWEIVEWWYVAR